MSTHDKLQFLAKGVETSFDGALKMTLQDFLYVCFLRKLSTMGAQQFLLDLVCPHCKQKQTKTLQFDDIAFDEIQAPALPAIVTVGGQELHISPITLEGYLKALKDGYAEREFQRGTDGQVLTDQEGEPLREPDDEVALMALQVTNKPFDEAYTLIESAVGEESWVLQSLDNYFFHGVKPHETACSKKTCGGKMSVRIDAKETLIYPFREGEDAIRDRVQFGVPNAGP